MYKNYIKYGWTCYYGSEKKKGVSKLMLTRKYYFVACAALLGILMILPLGCGPAEEVGDVEEEEVEEEEVEVEEEGIFIGGELIADQELYAAAVEEGNLVFYTAHTLDHERAVVDAFETRFPEIEVDLTRAGGATLDERMKTEEQAGELKADVVVNSDTNYIQEYYDLGWLLEHVPPAADMYPADAKREGYFYPTGASAIVIAYHTDLLDEEDAPVDWDCLSDERFAGRLGGQRLGGGAMWAMVAYLGDRGDLDIIHDWAVNEPIMHTSGAGLATSLVAGEFVATPMGLFAAYPQKYHRGAPLEIVWPESGFPLYIPSIALLNHGENPNAAKLFMNWYMSADGQSRLANARGQFSLRDDVLPAPHLPPLDQLNAEVVNPDVFLDADLRDQWVSETTRALGWED